LVNVTVSQNTATSAGGGLHCLGDATPRVVNSILWGDTPQEVYFNEAFDPSTATIAFSDVQGGESEIILNDNGVVLWLEGNIDQDPMFANPAPGGDFHLLGGSACIDAGTPFFVADGDTLLDLDPSEYTGGAPDMGALESPLLPAGIDPDVGPGVEPGQGPGLFPADRLSIRVDGPNPFDAGTAIHYTLRHDSEVTIALFDARGRTVRKIEGGRRSAGAHHVSIDGRGLGAGVYLLELRATAHGRPIRFGSRKLIVAR
jgi:predicted outer membrane repeat protein